MYAHMKNCGENVSSGSVFSNVSAECFPFFRGTDVTISFFIFFLATNFVVGFPANLCMIWSICGRPTEALIAEIHHLSPAVCEVLYCLGLPTQLLCFITCVWTDWSLPHQLYSLGKLQFGLVWIGRPIFQSCICVERYIAVVYPLVYIRLRQMRYKVAVCVLSWSAFLLILFTRAFIPQNPVEGSVWLLLMLCFFTCCCFSVLFSLKKSPPGDREGREETSGGKMKKRAFNILLVHLLCFMVNFLPFVVLFFFINDSVVYNVSYFFESLGIVCGLIHPILYIHRVGKFSWVREIILSFCFSLTFDLLGFQIIWS